MLPPFEAGYASRMSDERDATRREFLEAAVAVAAMAVVVAPACVRSPAPETDDSPVAQVRAFTLPGGVEPATVFRARTPERQ